MAAATNNMDDSAYRHEHAEFRRLFTSLTVQWPASGLESKFESVDSNRANQIVEGKQDLLPDKHPGVVVALPDIPQIEPSEFCGD